MAGLAFEDKLKLLTALQPEPLTALVGALFTSPGNPIFAEDVASCDHGCQVWAGRHVPLHPVLWELLARQDDSKPAGLRRLSLPRHPVNLLSDDMIAALMATECGQDSRHDPVPAGQGCCQGRRLQASWPMCLCLPKGTHALQKVRQLASQLLGVGITAGMTLCLRCRSVAQAGGRKSAGPRAPAHPEPSKACRRCYSQARVCAPGVLPGQEAASLLAHMPLSLQNPPKPSKDVTAGLAATWCGCHGRRDPVPALQECCRGRRLQACWPTCLCLSRTLQSFLKT